MRFHKVIDAVQWFPDKQHPMVKQVKEGETLQIGYGSFQTAASVGDYVLQAQKAFYLTPGDWIVNHLGEYSVVADHFFKQVYVQLDDSAIIAAAMTISHAEEANLDDVCSSLGLKPEEYSYARDYPKYLALCVQVYLEAIRGI